MNNLSSELLNSSSAFPSEEAELVAVLEELDRRETALFTTTTDPSDPPGQFVTVEDGRPVVHLHAGQKQAWESKARFVLVLSGAQSGKTCIGPWWLLREMIDKGPGNYILVAPTFRLLDKQAVPALNRAFATHLGLGALHGGASGEFRVSEEGHKRLWPHLPYEPTRIIFGYAENPNSLESLTAKAAWLDECGQTEFKPESYEAIQSRLAIHRGRILFTSTPYVFNWLKTEVHDRAQRVRDARRRGLPFNPVDADYDCVSFESRMNPVFSSEEWDRQKAILPRWRFDMRYRGLFSRPAGAVYDCWRGWMGTDDYGDVGHIVPAFVPDPSWPRYVGIDFGAPNFAAVFIAEELDSEKRKTGRLIVYREYSPDESKTMAEHIAVMRRSEPGLPVAAVGGAKSEGNWRQQAAADGYPIHQPDQPDVEVGIGRVYAAIQTGQLVVTADCVKLIDDLNTYSREVDESGAVLNDIEDAHSYHRADAARYVIGWLRRASVDFFFRVL